VEFPKLNVTITFEVTYGMCVDAKQKIHSKIGGCRHSSLENSKNQKLYLARNTPPGSYINTYTYPARCRQIEDVRKYALTDAKREPHARFLAQLGVGGVR
jgi:hypothetical protein